MGRDKELVEAIVAVANRRAATGDLVDYHQKRRAFASWQGIDNDTWRFLKDDCYRPPRRRSQTQPKKLMLASAVLWAELTSSEEINSPFGANWTRGEFTQFKKHFLPRIRRRLTFLGRIVDMDPAASADFHIGALVGRLVAEKEIAPHFSNRQPSKLLLDRVFLTVSSTTGVDIPSLLAHTSNSDRSQEVFFARTAMAHLLRKLGATSKADIAAALCFSGGGGFLKSDGELNAFFRRSQRDTDTIARMEVDVLRGASDEYTTCLARPHRSRMREVAAHIVDRVVEETTSGFGKEVATILAIRTASEQTDISRFALSQQFGLTQSTSKQHQQRADRIYSGCSRPDSFMALLVREAIELRESLGYRQRPQTYSERYKRSRQKLTNPTKVTVGMSNTAEP